jgi:hypothetical protein
MKPTLIAAAALLSLALSAGAGAQTTTGADIMSKCKQAVRDVDNDTSVDKPPVKSFDVGFCFGFIDGANSTQQVWTASDKTNHRNHAMGYCFSDAVTNGQMLRVFVKYLDDHPKELHEPAALLYIEAMRRAFPCGK